MMNPPQPLSFSVLNSDVKLEKKDVDSLLVDLIKTMAGSTRNVRVYIKNETGQPVNLQANSKSEYLTITATPRLEAYGSGSIDFEFKPPKDHYKSFYADWELEATW